MKIKTLLETEIRDECEHLNKMEVGTDEYKAAVDGITKLTDRYIEIEKLDAERAKNEIDREDELFYKDAQMVADKKNRIINDVIAIAGIVIPAGLAVWGTFKTFEFEKTGNVTTIMGRGFINKLLPKK